MKKKKAHIFNSKFRILFSISLILCLSIALIACGIQKKPEQPSYEAPSSTSISVPSVADDSEKSWPFNVEIDWTDGADISTLTEEGKIIYYDTDGSISFVTGDFSGVTVRNQEDAQEIAEAFVNDNQAIEGSDVVFSRSDTFQGITVYTFLQELDGMIIDQGVVKIIVKEDGVPVAIANSFLTEADEDFYEAEERDPAPDLSKRFEGFESEIYEADVTASLSETIHISVPVLKDPSTGNLYLADLQRKMICAELPEDTAEQIDSVDNLDVVCLQNSQNVTSKLITYSYMLRVYDYFAAKGWSAPDGLGTPCQIVFDDSGESNGNASYSGLWDGYQVFAFGVNDEASQSISVIAHEFMHGVSNTNHIGYYMNETGALDEAMSDIIGNCIESELLGIDKESNGWFSYFHEMHANNRPLYVWDEYYLPPASVLTASNDSGGVHTNSAIISMLSYRLAEAGMTFSEQFDFWFLFDLTLTPLTGIQETAARLPWCAEVIGMQKYAPVLRQAVKLLKMDDLSIPDSVLSHQCLLQLTVPEQIDPDTEPVTLMYYQIGAEYDCSTYPVIDSNDIAAVLPAGSYVFALRFGYDPELDGEDEEPAVYYLWNGNEWVISDEDTIYDEFYFPDNTGIVTLEGGGNVTLDTSSIVF